VPAARKRAHITPADLHPVQQVIHDCPARYVVAACGRRFGKTALAVEWLALSAGGAIDGLPVAIFAPTYKLLLDPWAELERTLRPLMKRSNRLEMRIELVTGGTIDGWTLQDMEAGRGRKYARVVIDEAAHSRNLAEVWERAISPTLTDLRGSARFLSTPAGAGYFRDLYRRGGDPAYPDWQSFHAPTSANPHISPAEIESRRLELPDLVYRQEYLAEFVEFGSGLVKPEMILDGIMPPGLPITLGVDLAISTKDGANYTAIVAIARDPQTGIVYIREAERHRVGFADALDRITAAAARHNPVMIAIEQTQYQAAVVQELARTTALPVRGVRPDRDKITRFAPLLTRYEQRMVRHDPSGVPAWFRDEVASFPAGAYDDGVDAAAYAYSAMAGSGWRIIAE